MSDNNTNQTQDEIKKGETQPETEAVKADTSQVSQPQEEKAAKSTEEKPNNAEESQEKAETPNKTGQEASTAETSDDKAKELQTDSDKNQEPARQSTPSDPSKNAHWYVIHAYSGHEQKVASTLKQRIDSLKLQTKILDIIIPTQEKIEIKEGKKSTVKEKIFPGYLLVNMIMDDNSWLAVRTTPGITGFIGTSTKPTPLPEEEVNTIKRYMTMEAPKFKTTFTQGEAVKITDGPFTEFLGTISEIDEGKGKLKVMVSVFGRETPVELDLLQVAKL